MSIYISHPQPGSIWVNPMCEVLVTFDVDPLRNEEVNIKIDSEWAVREGVVCEPFINTRTIKQNGVTQWGLRRHRGFPARDILVSAWVPHKHATYEQRFFVRGAETDVSIFVNKNNNYCRTFGGVFESDRARPFPSRISVSDQGQINLDDRTYFVPSKLISPVADIVRHDGTWLMCSSREGKTYIADPQHIHEFDFPAKNIKITPQLINVQVDSSRSAHLPTKYRPASNENRLSDWFCFEQEGRWNMEFEDEIHVWWNSQELIARHTPKPLRGKVNDMLWTKKDLREEIKSVKVVDKTHVLVNDWLYLNTLQPEITHV